MHERDFANRDVSHVVLARAADGIAVGFCSFWIVLDELHINNLAVLPGRRRLGIGSRLVEHVLREAQQRAPAAPPGGPPIERVIRLYTRWGFAVGRMTQPLLAAGSDALILWRENLPDFSARQRLNPREGSGMVPDTGRDTRRPLVQTSFPPTQEVEHE